MCVCVCVRKPCVVVFLSVSVAVCVASYMSFSGYAGASGSVCIYSSVVLSGEVTVWVRVYPCASVCECTCVCVSVSLAVPVCLYV